jgi:prepilin-type N-terminal cleavage/methylation domain-containing protein
MYRPTSKRGFTLIELLVVISIILIASSIIFIGGNAGGGASLSSSQRILSGVAQGARGQAILKNAETRLIIHNDPSDLDKYRRFVGIVYRGTDSSGTEGWIAATQGTSLPEGIYFDAATSLSESGSNWSAQPMSLNYPRVSAQTGGSTAYLYYSFNANGTSANANAYLVIRAGTMIPNANGTEVSQLKVTEDQAGLKSALIFRRAGTTTAVNEPSAINPSSATEIN